MTIQHAVRRFGPPVGAPGIVVLEKPGIQAFSDPKYGTTAMFGILKRGPMGVAIPVNSRSQYNSIYGDPRDETFHLFKDSSHLMPDAIDGFFARGGGAGTLWVTRIDLDGKARKATAIVKNRLGGDAFKITAANEGRWAGSESHVAESPVIFATSRTFTILAPDVESNQYVGALAYFSTSAKAYEIIANTATGDNGEVIFTLSPQYNLITDQISGPTALTGYSTYTRYTQLSGLLTFVARRDLTGTVNVNQAVIVGQNTLFTEELEVGDNIYYQGEVRSVTSITSNTTLTINEPLVNPSYTGITIQTDNNVLTGTGSAFEDELEVGDLIYLTIGGRRQGRTVASIESDTSLTLTSGYTLGVTDVVGEVDNYIVSGYNQYVVLSGNVSSSRTLLTGTITATTGSNTITGSGTSFNTQLSVGSRFYYEGGAYTVTAIASNTELTLSGNVNTSGIATTAETISTEIIGNGTSFTTELTAGDTIYLELGGSTVSRIVGAINSDTSLAVASPFPQEFSNLVVRTDNDTPGTNTAFSTEVTVGQYLIDPNRAGHPVKVVEVISNSEVRIEEPFVASFYDAALTKQNQTAWVDLIPPKGEGISYEIGQGIRFPNTHFSFTVYFNGSRVMEIQDASLDPNDPFFIEPLIDNANIAYKTGTQNYHLYISAESLWTGAYTTNKEDDVRPCNGAGTAMAITKNRIYTNADFNYADTVGNLLYPDPYALPRAYFRITGAQKPVKIEGAISSVGVNVTGVATTFSTSLKVGDYLIVNNQIRKITGILSDTHLVIETPFSSNLVAQEAYRSGYIEVGQVYDLTTIADVGSRFLVTYQEVLKGGYDGDTANILPFYFTKYFDVDTNFLESAVFGRNMGLVKVACPGISDVVIQKAGAFYCESKAYEFRGEVPSFYTSAAAAEAFVNTELGRNDFLVLAFPSYGYVASPLGPGDRYISMSGDILGGEANWAVAAEGYHRVFAGVNATLPRVIKLPFEPQPQDEAILNAAGLHPIKIASGNTVVFGARNPSLSDIYRFTHIRRIQSNFVRVFLEARTLLELLFLPNQPRMADQIIMTLENFARREYKKGVLTNYLPFNSCVSIGNLDSASGGTLVDDESGRVSLVSLVNGKLNILFRYIPTGILEVLSIHSGPDVLVAKFGDALQQETF